jgi:hypothetical protein
MRQMEADHSMDVESLLVRIEEEQQRFVATCGATFPSTYNIL